MESLRQKGKKGMRTMTPRAIVYLDRLWSLVLPGETMGRVHPVWVKEYRTLDGHDKLSGVFSYASVWHGRYTCRWYSEAGRVDGRVLKGATGHWALSDAMTEAVRLLEADDDELSRIPLMGEDGELLPYHVDVKELG